MSRVLSDLDLRYIDGTTVDVDRGGARDSVRRTSRTRRWHPDAAMPVREWRNIEDTNYILFPARCRSKHSLPGLSSRSC